MTRFNFWALTLLTLALPAIAPRLAHAAESYQNCAGFITTLPAVISTPGTWCFNQNLSTSITSGNAITINANNVTVDCNDFKLDGLAAGIATQTTGVYSSGFRHTTVRHCNVRGFLVGVSIGGNSDFRFTVEDNRFDGNTFIGLQVYGGGSVIRRNRVLDTGGTTLNAGAQGIIAGGSVDVVDNFVAGVGARSGGAGSVVGIYLDGNSDGSISGNRLRDLVKDGAGVAYGIYGSSSDRMILRNNDLVGNGSAGSVGLTCFDSNGRARDNAIKGFSGAIVGCSNDGGNVIKP